MNPISKAVLFVSFSLLSSGVYAQYPTLTAADKALEAYVDSITMAHSDSAWAVAYPIVLREARENSRPYIPFAKRPTDLPQASIPAFPGAEGGGMFSFGGRGGRVLTVTSLADDGPGSFRWACEQGGARIIVFNVSGVIRLKTPVVIRAPYVTIAGQTAPGEGVMITGESVWVNTHDVVVRHMRFRRAETGVARRDDTFGGNPVGNIMLDHLSCSFGLDENISFYRHKYQPGPSYPWEKYPTVNVTIQNSISAKALDTYNHAFGSTLGGENCAFVRNLWSCNTGRNPSIGWNGVFCFVNNVVFNWVHRTVDGGDWSTLYNIYNNYFKPGPATPVGVPISHRIVKPESGLSRNEVKTFGRVFCDGNIVEGNDSVSLDNWNGGVQIDNLPNAGQYESQIRWHSPHPHPFYSVMSAGDSYSFVLDNAGALYPCRDVIDSHIVDEVRTGKPYFAADAKPDTVLFKRRLPVDSWTVGIITDPQQYGGIPSYGKWKPYKDSDADGMPDDWEKKNGLNPNDPSDAYADCTGDGYSNIEKYINGISTKKCVDWTDLRNNHDTLTHPLR